MRSIAQPGPPVPERIQWVEARGRAFSFTLEGGVPLLEAARRGFALRLRPNQDFAAALETFCRQHAIFRAKLHGGVGSTIGACFTDGHDVVPFATELAITSGAIAAGANGTLEADIDIALVDY